MAGSEMERERSFNPVFPYTPTEPDAPLDPVAFRKRKVALITGITGQDGSYLTEFLLDRGYIVHGIVRRSSNFNTGRLKKLHLDEGQHPHRLHLHYGDMTDGVNIFALVASIKPTEIYNLAAQSHVKVSFEIPEHSLDVEVGALRLIEAVRRTGLSQRVRFFQASSSELFGNITESPQTEKTSFYPRSPYGVAKLYAYWITVNYRDSYGMYACNAILYNHESPRRGRTFVTRKISRGVAEIKLMKSQCIFLGNLDATRDWGHAKDYVEGMWLMLQQDKPDDFILATGEAHSVREFVELAFKVVKITIEWDGSGLDEVGRDAETRAIIIRIDPRYFRPTEQKHERLIGNPSKAATSLGWKRSVSFEELVKEMVLTDLEMIKNPLLEDS
ncbi:hypothetical protein FRB97_006239 [Tulasnella sp. 331]|nr:hypothetical protein FRB97_006239 [Tulasnella sp. 331]